MCVDSLAVAVMAVATVLSSESVPPARSPLPLLHAVRSRCVSSWLRSVWHGLQRGRRARSRAMSISARLGKVSSFLVSALQPTTVDRYARCIDDFSSELEARGVRLGSVSEEELDWLLAEKVVDLFEEEGGAVGIGQASSLLSAFSKVFPRHRYRTAWKALEVWRTRRPPIQAPAIPLVLALAVTNWLLVVGQKEVAAACLLCFTGLLRASEALRLRGTSVFRTSLGYVLILAKTKRGLEQKVLILEQATVQWLDCYRSSLFGRPPDSRICDVSYGKFQRWLQRAAHHLGFGTPPNLPA